MRRLLMTGLFLGMLGPCFGDGFEDPVLVTAEGQPIRVESPGYAAPCLADIDGDGVKDLLVGQFRDGKISLYRGKSDGGFDFEAQRWLEAGGEPASVPGVW